MKLGSFGAATSEINAAGERDTFEFFGREFTVHGIIPPMLMLRLGAAMAGEIGEIDSNAVIYKALRHALSVPGDPDNGVRPDESQFDQFEALAIKKMCETNELLRLVFALVGIPIAFPTEQQPTSQDGLPATGESSNSSASDTPDSGRLKSVDEVLAG